MGDVRYDNNKYKPTLLSVCANSGIECLTKEVVYAPEELYRQIESIRMPSTDKQIMMMAYKYSLITKQMVRYTRKASELPEELKDEKAIDSAFIRLVARGILLHYACERSENDKIVRLYDYYELGYGLAPLLAEKFGKSFVAKQNVEDVACILSSAHIANMYQTGFGKKQFVSGRTARQNKAYFKIKDVRGICSLFASIRRGEEGVLAVLSDMYYAAGGIRDGGRIIFICEDVQHIRESGYYIMQSLSVVSLPNVFFTCDLCARAEEKRLYYVTMEPEGIRITAIND